MTPNRRKVAFGFGGGLAVAALGPVARATATPDHERQIRALRAAFARRVALGDAGGAASLFTEDGRLEAPLPGGRVTLYGRAGLKAYLQGPGVMGSAVDDHIVHVTGDAAEGSCALRAADGRAIGVYLERLRRERDGWRWCERRLYVYEPLAVT